MPEVDPTELEFLARTATSKVAAKGVTPSAAVVQVLSGGSFSREHAQRVVELTNRELLAQHLSSAKTAAERKGAIPLASLEEVLVELGTLPDPSARASAEVSRAAVEKAAGFVRTKIENPLEVIFGPELLAKVAAEEKPRPSRKPVRQLVEQLKAAHAQMTTQLDILRPKVAELGTRATELAIEEVRSGSSDLEAVISAAARVSESGHILLDWSTDFVSRVGGRVEKKKVASYRRENFDRKHPVLEAYSRFEKTARLARQLERSRELLVARIDRLAAA